MYMKKIKYFSVTCKCGHVGGKKKFIPIKFPVKAESKKKAAEAARNIPRVKHHQACILDVREISYSDYLNLIEENNKDPYLKIKNKKEQKQFDLSYRIEDELDDIRKSKEISRIRIMDGKVRVKHPKKYFKFYQYEEEQADLWQL